MESLWGEEFKIEDEKILSEKILKKVKKPKELSTEQMLKSKTISLEQKLSLITSNVYNILGRYKDDTLVIKTKDQLINYIDEAIKNKIIAIDTETNNSLNPFTCHIMGPCIYTPGQKNAYIPINHINMHTGERLDWQLTEDDIYEQFSRLNCPLLSEPVKIITHNGKFDYEVLHFTVGWDMPIYWDTMIGSQVIDITDRASLKYQYKNKIDPSIEKYSIDHLFTVEYAIVDPDVFALYAATDSYMTYRLYLWQVDYFNRPENKKLFELFRDVEMPIINVAANMEISGISVDVDYCKALESKYLMIKKEWSDKINEELLKLKPQIDAWRLTDEANFHPTSTKPDKNGNYKLQKSKSEQLSDPPEITSSTQLAILLYDVLKVPAVDKKHPRTTDKNALPLIKIPLCDYILNEKKYDTLLNNFITKLPTMLSETDGRLHASFNQMGKEEDGVRTGRMSCTEPNLQQVPAKANDIRMMFKASDGCVFVGSDFSAQEPRILSALSGDEVLLKNLAEDKDVYATIGMGVYKNNYWDNMEHFPDGTKNVEGDKRRKKCKTLFLGLAYGMGNGLIAERMGVSFKEAKTILDDFYKGFPRVASWKKSVECKTKELGYSEDFWGRRRNLPNIKLPQYEFKSKLTSEFNPILNCKGVVLPIDLNLVSDLNNRLNNSKSFDEKDKIIQDADKKGITIIDNSGKIAQAERQSVNSVIQGSAATMTKKAMIKIHNDEEMKRLGFKLLIAVHDELIGECPIENAEEAGKRLTFLMSNCVPELPVKFKCDEEIETRWNQNKYVSALINEYENIKESISESEALERVCNNHTEFTSNEINEFLFGKDC